MPRLRPAVLAAAVALAPLAAADDPAPAPVEAVVLDQWREHFQGGVKVGWERVVLRERVGAVGPVRFVLEETWWTPYADRARAARYPVEVTAAAAGSSAAPSRPRAGSARPSS